MATPVSAVQRLQNIRDSIYRELDNESARRAALTDAGNPPPANYTSGGKQWAWTDYLATMLDKAAKINEQVLAMGGDGGLTEERVRGWT